MSSNQYLKEYLSMTVIGNFRREAALAEQCRLARAGNPSRNSVSTLFGIARRNIIQTPARGSVVMSLPSYTAEIK